MTINEWNISIDHDEGDFLILVKFVHDEKTRRARYDVAKKWFIDAIPIVPTDEQRTAFHEHVLSSR